MATSFRTKKKISNANDRNNSVSTGAMPDTNTSSKGINRLLEPASPPTRRRRRFYSSEDNSGDSAPARGRSTKVCGRLLEPILTILGIITAAGACVAAVFAITLYRSTNNADVHEGAAPPEVYFASGGPAEGGRPSWGTGRIFCLYDNKLSERQSSNFTIEDIGVQYCDDLVYAYVGLDNTATNIRSKLPQLDFLEEGFRRFTNLKRSKPEVNLWACMGGGTEDGARFQLLIKERKTRIAFARNSAEWLRRNQFQGLLIYWKYPGLGSRTNFTVLLLDLKNAFLRDKLLLSVVLPFSTKTRREGYYVQSIFECLDVVLLDGHRPVDPSTFPITTCSTPVKSLPRARHYGQYGLVRVLDDLATETEDFKKAILSVSMAGLSFTLRYKNIHRVGAAVSGAGPGGPRTNHSGLISYYEVKQLIQNETSGWKKMYHRYGRCPVAMSDGHWVGYEDERSLQDKAGVLTMAAGLAVWDMEMDDFAGFAGKPYPLLSKAHELVHGKQGSNGTSQPQHGFHKVRN